MTRDIAVSNEPASLPGSLRRLLWVGPAVMVAASIANLALYVVASRIAPEVGAWPGSGPAQIVGANVVYLLVAAVLLLIVNRLSSQPVRHYLIVASVGLLLSMALPITAGMGYGPPGTPPAGTATAITLSLMHLVSYAIAVPAYVRLVLEQ